MSKVNKEPEQGEKDSTTGRLSVFHDLYVDLLGSLVPGLLTVILGGAAIYLTLATVHVAMFRQPLTGTSFPGDLRDVLTSVHWEIATIILVSAYVVGAVFFRQDPKKPDAASALYVWMHSKSKERNGLAVQHTARELPRDFIVDSKAERPRLRQRIRPIFLRLVGCTSLARRPSPEPADKRPSLSHRVRSRFFNKLYSDVLGINAEFPYTHSRCYLAARGLRHLVRYVPWCPDKTETEGFRTKMFINILKIRLHSMFPDMARDIVQNEAHVRLATSVWYASTSLLWLSVVVIAILVLAATCCLQNGMASSLFYLRFVRRPAALLLRGHAASSSKVYPLHACSRGHLCTGSVASGESRQARLSGIQL